jgi:hypothetical protein
MDTAQRLLAGSTATILLTIAHHARGALLYESPFRLHVVLVALPVAAALGIAYRARSSLALGGVAWAVFLALSLFVGAAIGVYEGGYNHVVANVLYFAGAPRALFERIYPAVSEVPNDFWFGLTGVLQFPAGAYCLWLAVRLARRTSQRGHAPARPRPKSAPQA